MTEREALKLALRALEIGLPLIEDFGSTEQLNAQHKAITAIYEALAQRTWVGLTDKEIDELWMSHHDDFGNPLSATGYEMAIEAKLKEKNT